MFCPKCAKINPDSNDLCSNCGAILHEDIGEPIRKSSNFKAIVAILLFIALVVGIVLLLNGCNPGNIEQDQISF